MKKNHFCSVMLACSLLCANLLSTSVSAEQATEPIAVAAASSDASVMATGLIQYYTLSCSTGSGKIYISAKTIGYETMAKIGLTDIEIQRSSNGTSGWTKFTTLSDQIAENAVTHELSRYSVSVTGGYYYRVVVTHYAKEKGWFFPSSQSITGYSSAVWVS